MKNYLVADIVNGIVAQAYLDEGLTGADVVSGGNFCDSLSTLTDPLATLDTKETRKKIEDSGYGIN